jgi:ketosteroid isomerase-like protein
MLGSPKGVIGLKPLWIASVVVFLVLVALPRIAFAQSTSDLDAHQLQGLEQTWNQAHLAGDADALDKLWADDLEVDVPRMAPMTKEVALSFAKSGRMSFSRYVTSDIHIRVHGDMAAVTGRLQRTRTISGKELSDDWRFTKVYVRQDRQWRVVSFHASESAAQ